MIPLLMAAFGGIPALVVSADKGSVSGSGSGFAPSGDPGNTDVVTLTVVSGVSPYTYSWAQVGGNASSGPYEAIAPAAAATAFKDANDTVASADADSNETWRCTVTDDTGRQTTVDVTVTLTWTDLS